MVTGTIDIAPPIAVRELPSQSAQLYQQRLSALTIFQTLTPHARNHGAATCTILTRPQAPQGTRFLNFQSGSPYQSIKSGYPMIAPLQMGRRWRRKQDHYGNLHEKPTDKKHEKADAGSNIRPNNSHHQANDQRNHGDNAPKVNSK